MAEPAALDHIRDQVGRALSGFLTRQRAVAGEIAAELLPAVDAICGVLAGGKRLRAAFCYWGWRAAGGSAAPGIFDAAAALELLHAGALVHDDVIDRSDTRRGSPAAHRAFAGLHHAGGWRGPAGAFGNGAAVLTGDLLLAWADELFHDCGLPASSLARGQPILDAMRTEMLAGQYLDLHGQAAGDDTVAG
ncbi:MAG: polyprenyl synthetase family protein, partial [Streptosporangiaceae bacterium]